MAKERRATPPRATRQPARSVTRDTPSAAAAEQPPVAPSPPRRGRSGTGLYVELPREMKVELDVVAAMLQVPLNVLVGAVLSKHVSRDRVTELGKLADEYRASRGE